jgi:hypothetical protein
MSSLDLCIGSTVAKRMRRETKPLALANALVTIVAQRGIDRILSRNCNTGQRDEQQG